MNWKEIYDRAFQERQRYEPNPLQRAALSALLMTSVAGVVVLVLAVGRWFELSTPTWTLLIASLPIAGVATLMATSHEDKLSVQRLLGPALVSLGVTLSLGMVLGLLWREDGVRRHALDMANDHELSPVLMGAMRGKDEELGTLACQHMVGSRNEEIRQNAYRGLLSHPNHFSGCLGDSALHDEWGKRLVDGWVESMTLATEPDTICTWSQTLAMASQEVPGAAVALLSCALEREDSAQKTCCMDSIRSQSMHGDRLAVTLAQARPSALYERAMAVALTEQLSGKGAQELGIDQSELLKRYAYVAACRTMNIENQSLSGGLTDIVISRCQIREKSLRDDTSFWISVCKDLRMDADAKQDRPVEELFCDETRRRMVVRASSVASRTVHAATLTPQTQDLARMEKLAGIINTAARQSGFVPSDSTGIVGEYETSRYSRSASNQALHKLGERRMKKQLKEESRNESKESRQALERAIEAQKGQPQLSEQQERARHEQLMNEY